MPLHPLIHCPNGPRLRSETADSWKCDVCGDWHAGATPAKPVQQDKTYAHGDPFDPTQRLPLPFAPLNDIPIAFPTEPQIPALLLPAKPILKAQGVSKAGPVEMKAGPPPPGLPPGFLRLWSKPAKPPADA